MILTISGTPGSGKDTVAEILSKELDYKLLSMGNIKREAAKEKGMTLEEFNTWCETNPEEGDVYFDDYQKKFGLKNNNFIMVARLGWLFIPHSIKIYIDVDETEGARRIFEQKKHDGNVRNEFEVATVEDQVKLNKSRVNGDIKRYQILYKVNLTKKENYNIVIDSTDKTPEEVAKEIINQIKN